MYELRTESKNIVNTTAVAFLDPREHVERFHRDGAVPLISIRHQRLESRDNRSQTYPVRLPDTMVFAPLNFDTNFSDIIGITKSPLKIQSQ